MELRTFLFETKGPENTDQTLEIALERALALGIKQVVVASSHGSTAQKAHALMAPHGISIIAITLGHGWESLGWCMTPDERRGLEELGVTIITGIHGLGDDVATAFSAEHGGRSVPEIVRDVLYRFSQGMKVAVEGIFMAGEAGALDLEKEVISIAGSSTGADTAIVCKPACARQFFDLEIREVLAKPRVP